MKTINTFLNENSEISSDPVLNYYSKITKQLTLGEPYYDIRNTVDSFREKYVKFRKNYPRDILLILDEISDGFGGTNKIFLIDADIVKKDHDMDFTEAANGLAVDYIPKDEIWLDIGQPAERWKHILFHELIEMFCMRHFNMSYDSAHEIANKFEKTKIEADVDENN